ncbi:MAG: 5'-methylthioadenosine/S-adenosylhomocysteine nucleosidase [Mycobacteriaceae bacterium]|nr:5'-methylthioadenosine/S-adenosylhomocysteine nucleosidase [Mycobacteriaceae bacterium]
MTDTVVVLTATDIEYNAVRRHLDDIDPYRHTAGTRFEIGTLHGTTCRIALALANVGNHSSAVIAERAIQEFAPCAVLFSGIAGSLWSKPGLGDIVVAERVYSYQGGTSEHDGLKARPRAWEAPHEVSQIAHALDRAGDWRKRLPSDAGEPEVRFGAIAAGEILKNSDRSREALHIREHYNDAIAIEMEAAGVAHAGHLNNVMVGIIRGISDMSDGTKNTEDDARSQPRAAQHAAAFAVSLAEALCNDREEHLMNKHEQGAADSAGQVTVHNHATGSVGIQAGQVSNSTVWMSAAPSTERPGDLFAVITDLLTQLDRVHASGDVDDDLYVAAIEEIDTAEGALREPDRQGRKEALFALKRLGGLLGELTEIAAKISLVMAGVNALS